MFSNSYQSSNSVNHDTATKRLVGFFGLLMDIDQRLERENGGEGEGFSGTNYSNYTKKGIDWVCDGQDG